MTYEYMLEIAPGDTKYVRIPVKAVSKTEQQAAKVGLKLRWDALNPNTGDKLTNYGVFEVQETTWIVD